MTHLMQYCNSKNIPFVSRLHLVGKQRGYNFQFLLFLSVFHMVS